MINELTNVLMIDLIDRCKRDCTLDSIIIWRNPTEEGYPIIRGAFEKIKIQTKLSSSESILCHLNIDLAESIDKNDIIKDSRFVTFDIYKDEMISLKNIICKDAAFEIFSTISNITSKKYTFHEEGIPILTIDKEDIYYWSKK